MDQRSELAEREVVDIDKSKTSHGYKRREIAVFEKEGGSITALCGFVKTDPWVGDFKSNTDSKVCKICFELMMHIRVS